MRSLHSRRLLFIVPVFAFAVLNFSTQQYYVERSRAMPGRTSATFVEIPDASASHLLDEFATLEPLAQRSGTIFVSDTFNIVYAKIENFYTKPAAVIFPSDDFLRASFRLPTDPILRRMLIPSQRETALRLSAMRRRHYSQTAFKFFRPHGRTIEEDGFLADNRVPYFERNPRDIYLIADTALQSMMNRWYNSDYQRNFDIVPLNRIRNHLIFIAARYGLAYYTRSQFTSLFQLEPDLFYDGKTMAGIGRRLLFDIVNPSKRIRLEMTYTETLKDDGKCRLYSPSILGASSKRIQAQVVGRGSARVFFPPVVPRVLVGQTYVLLDMDVDGTLFPMRRTGLMRLYGMKYPLDARRLVGFGRDISAISDDEYDRLDRPSFLADPPADLLNKNLEYSGAYEDGWISEASQYVLARPQGSQRLIVRGLVPLIGDPNYHSRFVVLLNGRVAGRGEAGIGTLEMHFPAGHASGAVKVRLLFDRYQRLPGGDDRPVAMKLYALGFQNAQESAAYARSATLSSRKRSDWWSAEDKSGVQFGNGWYPLETYGGQTFRWANNDAAITVRIAKSSELVVDVEPGPGEGGRPGVLHLLDAAGEDVGSKTIVGRQLVKFTLPQGASPKSFVLHIDGGGAKVPSDPRILDFRVFSVSVR